MNKGLLDLPVDCLLYISHFFSQKKDINSVVRTCKYLNNVFFHPNSASCENIPFTFGDETFQRSVLSRHCYPFVRNVTVILSFMEKHIKRVKLLWRFPNVKKLTIYGRTSLVKRERKRDPFQEIVEERRRNRRWEEDGGIGFRILGGVVRALPVPSTTDEEMDHDEAIRAYDRFLEVCSEWKLLEELHFKRGAIEKSVYFPKNEILKKFKNLQALSLIGGGSEFPAEALAGMKRLRRLKLVFLGFQQKVSDIKLLNEKLFPRLDVLEVVPRSGSFGFPRAFGEFLIGPLQQHENLSTKICKRCHEIERLRTRDDGRSIHSDCKKILVDTTIRLPTGKNEFSTLVFCEDHLRCSICKEPKVSYSGEVVCCMLCKKENICSDCSKRCQCGNICKVCQKKGDSFNCVICHQKSQCTTAGCVRPECVNINRFCCTPNCLHQGEQLIPGMIACKECGVCEVEYSRVCSECLVAEGFGSCAACLKFMCDHQTFECTHCEGIYCGDCMKNPDCSHKLCDPCSKSARDVLVSFFEDVPLDLDNDRCVGCGINYPKMIRKSILNLGENVNVPNRDCVICVNDFILRINKRLNNSKCGVCAKKNVNTRVLMCEGCKCICFECGVVGCCNEEALYGGDPKIVKSCVFGCWYCSKVVCVDCLEGEKGGRIDEKCGYVCGDCNKKQ